MCWKVVVGLEVDVDGWVEVCVGYMVECIGFG